MTPSVRGRERVVVTALLVAAAAVAGGAVGAVLGLAAAGLPRPSAAAVAGVAGLAVVADLAGRPRPPAVRRQVPWAWSRLFSLRTVAVLYGARLGVGPLTILPTWLWWAAVVVGAWLGVGASVAAGATFGGVRMLVVAAVAGRRAALHRADRRAHAVSLAGAAVACVAVLAAGCVGGSDAAPTTTTTSTTTSSSTTVPPSPSTTTTTVLTGLAAVVVAEGPDSFREAAGGPLPSGPLDLAAAAALEDDARAERARLARHGFRSGFARSWTGPAGRTALAVVYEFASEAGAHGYLDEGVARLEGEGAAFFDVAGVAESIGFRTADPGDPPFHADAVVVVRNARVALVVVGGPDPTTSLADVVALARAQAARLVSPR